jgi:hypothetical protein
MECRKPHLDPLLAALQQLRLRGLMAAAVAAFFHHPRVMPLCRRRLRLDQMTPEASLEGTQMSHESLALEEVLRRARRMVGNFKVEEANRVPMRPTEGFEPVVRILGLVCLCHTRFQGQNQTYTICEIKKTNLTYSHR